MQNDCTHVFLHGRIASDEQHLALRQGYGERTRTGVMCSFATLHALGQHPYAAIRRNAGRQPPQISGKHVSCGIVQTIGHDVPCLDGIHGLERGRQASAVDTAQIVHLIDQDLIDQMTHVAHGFPIDQSEQQRAPDEEKHSIDENQTSGGGAPGPGFRRLHQRSSLRL